MRDPHVWGMAACDIATEERLRGDNRQTTHESGGGRSVRAFRKARFRFDDLALVGRPAGQAASSSEQRGIGTQTPAT